MCIHLGIFYDLQLIVIRFSRFLVASKTRNNYYYTSLKIKQVMEFKYSIQENLFKTVCKLSVKFKFFVFRIFEYTHSSISVKLNY